MKSGHGVGTRLAASTFEMFRTASLLIVTCLATTPAMKVACEVWCDRDRPSHAMNAATCRVPASGSALRVRSVEALCDSPTEMGPGVIERSYRPVPVPAALTPALGGARSQLVLRQHNEAAFSPGDPGPPPGHTTSILRV